MTTPRDFSTRTSFPGTYSSRFDFVLRFGATVRRLPTPIFCVFLLLLVFIPTRELPLTISQILFSLSDWLLIAALPRARKSFGPAKPPTLLLAILRAPFAALPPPFNFFAQTIGTLFVIYGFWIEPHRIGVTRQKLVTAKLNSHAPLLRVLHLGDLHVERRTARERQLVALARELEPDLILFSGDFLNLSNVDDPLAYTEARAILRELAAPLGVYAVTGSPPVDKPHVVARLLDGLKVRWLRDERVTVNHRGNAVDVVGVSCTHRPHVDRESLAATLNGVGTQRLTILLYHSPDLAPEAALQGVDLQLSGHTHGGQVRLPFFGALYTASLYGKRLEMGRREIGGMTLYVTRGIGMEGAGAPRVRFLCPPEIVLWEIGGMLTTDR